MKSLSVVQYRTKGVVIANVFIMIYISLLYFSVLTVYLLIHFQILFSISLTIGLLLDGGNLVSY